MRIVAGKHKGRMLAAPKGSATRPTADRAREAIFNVIAHGLNGPGLQGAQVADVFAGTGALGLEALSRGAAHCTFVESDRGAARVLKANICTLGEAVRTTVMCTKAVAIGAPVGGSLDYVFLDAPYGVGLSEPALAALSGQGWLKDGALAMVEISARETLSLPQGFTLIKEKSLGAARVLFLRYENASGALI